MIDAETALSMAKQNQKQPERDFNRRQYNRFIKLANKRIVKACKNGQTDCCICSYYDITILNGDFEQVLEHAKKNDFIYLDPPYAPMTDDSTSFVSYTLNGFGLEEQERLRDVFVELDKRGCYVMLSNSSVPLIHDLYSEYAKTTKIVGATRMINSNAKKRGKVDEVIITNY